VSLSLGNIPCDEIIVQRISKVNFNWAHIYEARSVSSWPLESSTSRSINILLVVARDTSRNPARYSDVSPSLALGILAKLQDEFRSRSSSARLNIEVVRPGTIQAFEAHLLRSEALHGAGYFHIVHFDLHGAVRELGESKAEAYLFFSKKNSDLTIGQQASRVGKILKGFGVEFVLLNACESARANAGDSANIARTFENEVISNVLAMAFKNFAQSAEIFLRYFYEGLLLRGRTISSAAAYARRALFSLPKRHARFGLERDLPDWLVPVSYCSERDLKFVELETPSPHEESRLVDHQVVSGAEPLENSLVGREFDLLRLENVITTSRTVYVHGVLGVGKSVFLKYASSVWTSTNFVQQVIFLDFQCKEIHTTTGLIEAMLNRLHVLEKFSEGSDSYPNNRAPRSSAIQMAEIYVPLGSCRRCRRCCISYTCRCNALRQIL
jgi:hypothetical protein